MSNVNSILEGLNEFKDDKKVLSDFKKGDLVQVFGHKCDYIIKSVGKKSYKLQAVNPEKRDAIEIKYFNPGDKEVFLSTDNKYVITEGKMRGPVYRGLRIVKKADGTFSIYDKLDQEVDSGHKNMRSAKKAIDFEIDTWGEDDAFGGVIIID